MSLGVAARLAVAVILATSWGCGREPESAPPSNEQTPEDTSEEVSPGVRRTGPNQYEIRMQAFEGGYRPSEFRVPVGAEVTFHVTSQDISHGFTIEGTGVALELEPNSLAEAKHTFSEPGEYTFLCHVYCGGGHESMHGKIIVEAP